MKSKSESTSVTPEGSDSSLDKVSQERSPAEKPDGSVAERNGPKGPEPTRYGDWERNGIAKDF